MKQGLPVINFLGLVLLLLCSLQAVAGSAIGKVAYLSGTVSVQRSDGSVKVLAQDSELMASDIVSTESNSVVRVNFTDGSQITLRQNSRIKLDEYSFDEAKPAQDSLIFSVMKGGLRAVTGLVGKRGNKDAYKAKSMAATIGIRGTRYGVLLCGDGDCADMLSDKEGPEKQNPPQDGLYLEVTEGAIVVTNNTGSRIMNIGEFSYVRDANSLPKMQSVDPGLQKALPSDLSSKPGATNSSLGVDRNAACIVN